MSQNVPGENYPTRRKKLSWHQQQPQLSLYKFNVTCCTPNIYNRIDCTHVPIRELDCGLLFERVGSSTGMTFLE